MKEPTGSVVLQSTSWFTARCHTVSSHGQGLPKALFKDLFLIMCGWVGAYVYISTNTLRCQKRALATLEMKLQAVVSHSKVLGTELGSPTRVVHALNY